MLQALSVNGTNLIKRICTDIISGRDTVEHQKTVCGKFLQKVFEGDYQNAFRIADNCNKHAFLRWLIDNNHLEEADRLIKNNGYIYHV